MIKIKELRKNINKTQKEIANAIKISTQVLSRYELEERQADYITLCKLADYFGVTVDYLLGREPESGLIYVHKNPALTKEQQELLAAYDTIDPTLRLTALNVLKTLGGAESKENTQKGQNKG